MVTHGEHLICFSWEKEICNLSTDSFRDDIHVFILAEYIMSAG